MIDAKKINILLFLLSLLVLFLPPIAILIILAAMALMVLLVLGLRLAAVFSRKRRLKEASFSAPFVSIVVACANEPHALLSLTLDHMDRLDYDKYEVLVLDNNNLNIENWRKIEEKCIKLGPKFHFVHVDHVDGYKAGALNLANDHVSPQSEVLAIVDADYLVEPDFLKVMASYFDDPTVAIVQAPQDYCDEKDNPGLYCNYRSFFAAYMNQAQYLDTVTFTGTMGMIRRQLFGRGLKWNEWCITEDTEAGIFIHALGYRGVYLDRPFGRGLMPFSYQSLIKQRSRWSYGNMQIILKNMLPILASKDFSFKQKAGFMTQLVAWIRFDLVLLIILVISLIQLLLVLNPVSLFNAQAVVALLGISLIAEIVFFIRGLDQKFKLFDKIMALLTHYALLFTMSYSWIYMMLGGRLGFLVTSKTKDKNNWMKLLISQELIIPTIIVVSLLLMRLARLPQGWLLIMSLLFLIEISGIIYLSGKFRRLS